MRMVNRMVPITSGDILLDGQSVTTRKAHELRRDIGYAIQQIGLFPHETVADNIATVPKLLGWPKDRVRARVAELLDMVSLPQDMAERYPAQLSGGQRQRIGVARALASDPSIMLMDEPFGAIDPITRDHLQNEFLRLQGQLRKTIVFVTHDIDEAIKMGDRIAVLKTGGVLAQYATPAELLLDPADDFVEDFVGADRALKRLALLRVRDVDLWKAPRVRPGDLVAEARSQVAESDLPYPCSSTPTASRWGGSRIATWRASAYPSGPAPHRRRCSTRTRSCATRWPGCSRRTPSTGRWSMSAAGPRACSRWS